MSTLLKTPILSERLLMLKRLLILKRLPISSIGRSPWVVWTYTSNEISSFEGLRATRRPQTISSYNATSTHAKSFIHDGTSAHVKTSTHLRGPKPEPSVWGVTSYGVTFFAADDWGGGPCFHWVELMGGGAQ